MFSLTFLIFLLSASLAGADSAVEARRLLTEAAQHKEGDKRKEAAVALSLVPATDPVSQHLDQLLRDKDYQVRVAAVEALGDLDDRKRLGLLKTALSDEVPEVGFAAARELYALKAPEGKEALEAVFFGEMKARSGFFKKEMMNSWRRLKTPKSAMLFGLQRGIGFVPVPGLGAGYNALAGVLSDADLSARALSLLSICQTKGALCSELLEMAYKDEDWSVRAVALHVGMTQNSRAALPAVESLFSDKKDRVQLRAAAVYLRLARPGKSASMKKKL